MTGTFVNTGTIIAGSIVGVVAGKRLPERIHTIVMNALGLSVVLIGMQMSLTSKDAIITIACLLLGAITGELLQIEQGIAFIGRWLRKRTGSDSSTFVEGFVTSSVLYLTGAMTIVGSIQDGTMGDTSTLFVKSLLDGVASVALASTLGIGVAFSAFSVLLVQGTITLLSSELAFLQRPEVLNGIIATGGVLILGIGTNLLGITKIRIGNFIPAIFYAILWALFA